MNSTLTRQGRAAKMLSSWRSVAHRFRHLLALDLQRRPSKAEVDSLKPPSEAKALRCKARYFAAGLALSSQAFIDQLFGLTPTPSATNAAPARAGSDRSPRLQTFRDLRQEPVQT